MKNNFKNELSKKKEEIKKQRDERKKSKTERRQIEKEERNFIHSKPIDLDLFEPVKNHDIVDNEMINYLNDKVENSNCLLCHTSLIEACIDCQ